MSMFQVSLGLLLLSVSAATSLAEERVRGSLDVLALHAAFDPFDPGRQVVGIVSAGNSRVGLAGYPGRHPCGAERALDQLSPACWG